MRDDIIIRPETPKDYKDIFYFLIFAVQNIKRGISRQ